LFNKRLFFEYEFGNVLMIMMGGFMSSVDYDEDLIERRERTIGVRWCVKPIKPSTEKRSDVKEVC
jgi:hypothetical protein